MNDWFIQILHPFGINHSGDTKYQQKCKDPGLHSYWHQASYGKRPYFSFTQFLLSLPSLLLYFIQFELFYFMKQIQSYWVTQLNIRSKMFTMWIGFLKTIREYNIFIKICIELLQDFSKSSLPFIDVFKSYSSHNGRK